MQLYAEDMRMMGLSVAELRGEDENALKLEAVLPDDYEAFRIGDAGMSATMQSLRVRSDDPGPKFMPTPLGYVSKKEFAERVAWSVDGALESEDKWRTAARAEARRNNQTTADDVRAVVLGVSVKLFEDGRGVMLNCEVFARKTARSIAA